MRHEPRDRTRSSGPSPDDLVGDVDVAAARVLHLARLHTPTLDLSMAVTVTERGLLIDGEWVETGDWIEVRSPYSGEVVGRVAKGGAAEARRALDAAERALSEPLPAHKRAEILVKVAGLIGRRHEEVARTICEEAGKPIKTARVEASRAMSTYTFAAVEARKLAGRDDPDGCRAGRRGQARLHGAQADRRSSARSRRSTFRATSSRTSSHLHSPPAAQSS